MNKGIKKIRQAVEKGNCSVGRFLQPRPDDSVVFGESSMDKELQLIWIKWLDSESTSEWKTRKEYLDKLEGKEVNTCETVGWVLEDTKEALSIAQSRCEKHDCYDAIMRIPRCCIQDSKYLIGETS